MNTKQKWLVWIVAMIVFFIGLVEINNLFTDVDDFVVLVGKMLVVLVPAGLIYWTLGDRHKLDKEDSPENK